MKKVQSYILKRKLILLIVLLGLFMFSPKNVNSQCGFTINISQSNNGCNDINNGFLTANVLSNDINYVWLNMDGDTLLNVDTITPLNFLNSGYYIVFATDTVTGCTQYQTAKINSYFNNVQFNNVNVSCPTCEDGVSELLFTGGTNTFKYQWDDVYSQTTRISSDLAQGFYSVLLKDSFDCETTEVTEILDCGSDFEIDFIVSTASCINCNDASIIAIPPSGSPNYSYQWDDALNTTDSVLNNISIHDSYNLIITDENLCQKIFTIDSTEFCKASITPLVINLNLPSCYTCNDLFAIVSATGSHAPFTFLWENGSFDTTLIGEAPGVYLLEITDTIGCKINYNLDGRYCYDSMYLFLGDTFYINNQYKYEDTLMNNYFGALMKPYYSIAQPAKQGVVDIDVNGIFTYKPYKSYSGIDFFTYKVLTDCGFSNEVKVYLNIQNNSMVWPGDVDKNGIVENLDLLPLAVFYDSTGFARFQASESYYGQFAMNWSSNQINNQNIKHADCNGDAIIDSLDSKIIDKNYNPIHSVVNDTAQGNFSLSFESIKYGDTIELKVILGDTLNIASDVYGLAYTVNFDKTLIKSDFVEIKFNDSWFTPDTNRITISKSFLEKGRIDIAQSRIDGSNMSGSGEICSIIIVIEEDLDEEIEFINVSLSNVKLIQNNEVEINVNKKSENVVISKINELVKMYDFEFNLFPNPSNGKFDINLNKKSNYNIEISNCLGVIVFEKEISNKQTVNLDLKLSNGLYFIKVKSGTKEAVSKLMILK